jgi:hypothetical protein
VCWAIVVPAGQNFLQKLLSLRSRSFDDLESELGGFPLQRLNLSFSLLVIKTIIAKTGGTMGGAIGVHSCGVPCLQA